MEVGASNRADSDVDHRPAQSPELSARAAPRVDRSTMGPAARAAPSTSGAAPPMPDARENRKFPWRRAARGRRRSRGGRKRRRRRPIAARRRR
eukprot:348824-Pyramimonas_sp.AAC.1